jgi:hypothetical protein
MIILFCLINNCEGQKPVKIYGQVLSASTKAGISFASVVVKSTGKGTVARENGFFEIDLPSDTSTVIVSSMGYKSKEVRFATTNTSTLQFVYLEDILIKLDEITIITDKERIVRMMDDFSSVKISPILVAKLPGIGEVDIMRSFQLLPGISATNETSSGLYVRGGTPDQNLILFDGMTIYHVDHLYGFYSAFNAFAIDDIELIKGGFPAKYGGRISSVMNITGKPADLNKFKAGGTLSLLSANLYLDIPIIKNKLAWQITARRSYTDIIKTKLYNKIYNLYNQGNTNQQPGGGFGRFQTQSFQPKFYFYDINSKLEYLFNEKNNLSLTFYNSKDNLDNSRDLTSFRSETIGQITDIAGWGNIGTSFRWKHKWNSNFNAELLLSYSNYFSNRDRENNVTPGSTNTVRAGINTTEDNNIQDVGIKYHNELNISDNNILEFGLENTFNKISYKLINNDTSVIIDRNNNGNLTAVYIQDKISLLNKKNLILLPGIRTTYFNVINKIYFEPRFSFTYEPWEKLKIKGAWGIYYQFHTRVIREDILQGSKDFWLLADGKTLPVNKAIHYILGISYEKSNYLFDIEGFYKDMSGLSEYSLRITDNMRMREMRTNPREYFFIGKGYSKGIEVLLQKKYGKNTGWIGYTLSETKYTFPDLNYGKPYFALHDQTHEFKTVFVRSVKNWDLSADFIFATGKPYTAPISEYQLTLLDGSTFNYIHVSEKNSMRLPSYNRLDISATYKWEGTYTENALSLSIFNVYNRKNVWYKEFEIAEEGVTVTDITLLGTTPNISLTIKLK